MMPEAEAVAPRRWWLDGIASVHGFAIVLAVLISTSLVFGKWLIQSTSRIDEQADKIDVLASARAHLALNELLGLSSELHQGMHQEWSAGEIERVRDINLELRMRANEMEARVRAAADRAERLGIESSAETLRLGLEAVKSMRAVVVVTAMATGPGEIIHFLHSREYLSVLDRARTNVFGYLDSVTQMRVEQQAMQSARIDRLTAISLQILVMFTVAMVGCLILLRREVQARNTRDLAEDRAQRLAFYDHVTGLANRASFTEVVETALGNRTKSALILIDLDRFKEINDRHGHLIGDEVLKSVANHMREMTADSGGLAARLGGDEFAIFFVTDDPRFLRAFCADLIERCAQPMQFDDLVIRPGLSVGIATSSQLSVSKVIDMDDLTRVADFALYASKAAGRGCYTFYDSDLRAQFNAQRELEKGMPGATERGEIEVYLQPKVDLLTQETISFEALSRWNRSGAVLAPGEFIPIAEQTGMIEEIDRFMLDRAIELISGWNDANGTGYSVSVNLSARHFKGEDGLDFVSETLDRHGFPPDMLTLEITESIQLDNWAHVERMVNDLRDLGCRISIDDFGVGFSSLAYLRMIKADELKIDRELVREIESSDEAQFILDAVLELSEHLGLDVVVEGIEEQSQVMRLLEMGCRVGQGYLFSRPKPAAEALADAQFRLDAKGGATAAS